MQDPARDENDQDPEDPLDDPDLNDEDEGADESEVTRLFDAYIEAVESGQSIDLGRLLSRAGAVGDELWERIDLDGRLRGQDPVPAQSPKPPKRIGRFEIRESLGKGGLGEVFLAYDPQMHREVALKVLRFVGRSQNERAWILNEARSLARLAHPGIVRVFDVGSDSETDYIAMEPLEGPNLRQVLQLMDGEAVDAIRSPEIANRITAKLGSIDARLALFRKITDAVAYCHNRGILHRDLKPSNVQFDAAGEPRLLDFGLAHQDDTGDATRPDLTVAFLGTSGYVAPEQIENAQTGADPRSDQFSLCILGYELLSLEHPFPGKNNTERMSAITRTQPASLRRIRPEISKDLARVIHHGLANQPDDRYPTVQALNEDLEALAKGLPISIDDPSLGHLLGLWVRRNRLAVGLGAVFLATILGALLVASITNARANRASILAQLDGLEPREFVNPEDFTDSYPKLSAAMILADGFDQSFWNRSVAGPVSPEIQPIRRAWSEQLGEAYPNWFAVDKQRNLLLFALDEVLFPEGTHNERYRLIGTIRLPEDKLEGLEFELYRMRARGDAAQSRDPYDALTAYELVASRIPITPVDPGGYLFRAWKPDSREIVYEYVFTCLSFDQVLEMDPRAPRPGLKERAVLASARRFEFGDGPSFDVPEFWIAKQATTQAEFDAFVEDTGFEHGTMERGQPSDPARVSPLAAEAYAQWAGARLPRFLELMYAHDEGLLELASDKLIFSEYLSDRHCGTLRTDYAHFFYSDLRRGLPNAQNVFGPQIADDPYKSPADSVDPDAKLVAFRLVFHAAQATAYAETNR